MCLLHRQKNGKPRLAVFGVWFIVKFSGVAVLFALGDDEGEGYGEGEKLRYEDGEPDAVDAEGEGQEEDGGALEH